MPPTPPPGRPLRLLALASVLLCSCAAEPRAQVVFAPFVSGLTSPVDLQPAPRSNLLYAVEQPGRIRVISGTTVRTTPFLDITARVEDGGELGLLGLAFHPRYPDSSYAYVHYTRVAQSGSEPYQTVIARFVVTDSLTANPASERILLVVDDPFGNHNAGALHFGPDGHLYVTMGDGGSGGDPRETGQNTADLLGSILRINVDGAGNAPDCGGATARYRVPADNPLANGPGGACDEVYAYGLRNPWRISFDRLTGDLWAGDVGQGAYEEVDVVTAGGNYGWDDREGAHCYEPTTGCATAGRIDPVWEYPRSQGFSITGGYVYRGTRIASLVGKYVYGDYGSRRIWSLQLNGPGVPPTNTQLIQLASGNSVSSFGQDRAGELYVVTLGGTIYRMDPATVAGEDGPAPAALTLALVGPNPVRDRATLRIAAAAAGAVRLVLLDGLGREVAALFDGALAAGASESVALDASALAPGVYVARLDGPGGQRSLRLAVVR